MIIEAKEETFIQRCNIALGKIFTRLLILNALIFSYHDKKFTDKTVYVYFSSHLRCIIFRVIICTKIYGEKSEYNRETRIWWNRDDNFSNYDPSTPPPFLPFGSNTYVIDSWKRNRLLLSNQLSCATSITDIMRVGMFFFFPFSSFLTRLLVSPTEKNRDFPVFFCAILPTTVEHAIRICYTPFALPINPRVFYPNKKLRKENKGKRKKKRSIKK